MAQQAIEELKLALMGTIPLLNGTYQEGNGKAYPRLQSAPGDHSKNPDYKPAADPHVDGRALDIILFASELKEKIIAENIFAMFNAFKEELRWASIIYNRYTIDDFGGPRLYERNNWNDHRTHIHIEWSATKAGTSGFKDLIWEELKQINEDSARGTLSSVDISHLGRIEVGKITTE
jgi:hypothetical protein